MPANKSTSSNNSFQADLFFFKWIVYFDLSDDFETNKQKRMYVIYDFFNYTVNLFNFSVFGQEFESL